MASTLIKSLSVHQSVPYGPEHVRLSGVCHSSYVEAVYLRLDFVVNLKCFFCEFFYVKVMVVAPLFQDVQGLDDAPVSVLVVGEQLSLFRYLFPNRGDLRFYLHVGCFCGDDGVHVRSVLEDIVPLFLVVTFSLTAVWFAVHD